jgi:Protein of unknown function (DUF2894)
VAESAPTTPSCAAPSGAGLRDRLAALGEVGLRLDPVGLHFLESMATRLEAHEGPARGRLEVRLTQALDDYAQGLARAQAMRDEALAQGLQRHPEHAREWRRLASLGDLQGMRRLDVQSRFLAGLSPMVELNRHTQGATEDRSGQGREAGGAPELKSIERFRLAWSRVRTDQHIERAAGRAPENAGPLNSHLLMLRAAERLRETSPEYLRRFLSYADSLLWLDEIAPPKAVTPTRSVRRIRKKP